MESDLQRASSFHHLPSAIGIVDETPGLTGQLGPFHAGPPFTSLHNVGPQQPLQTANPAQNAIDLAGNAQQAQDNGMALLQSASQPFQQATYDGLATPSMSFAGHLQGMKLIPNPPDLEYWRNRLFHVDEVITMSEEQYVISCPDSWEHRKTSSLTDESACSVVQDSKPTSLTLTTSTPIVLPKDTSADPLYPTTGTADSRAGRREPPSPTTLIRKSASALRGSEIFATSKSRLQSTSPAPGSWIRRVALRHCQPNCCPECIRCFQHRAANPLACSRRARTYQKITPVLMEGGISRFSG